ncbi:MAG: ATP-binding cassette subfamily F protein 3 [Planctomycetota bacterium]|jgi:ATP-binding cassette subfamily F protein 3
MSLLIAENLQRHYGAQEVLTNASLRIELGDKIGLVGRNGGGKSTLLRIIEGLEQSDGGKLTLARKLRLGHVPQRPHFAPGVTARGYVELGLKEVHDTERELDRVGEAMGTADGDELERLMIKHGELSEHMEFLGGWDAERRVETVLSGIGLPNELWDREAAKFSGGEASRTALARELIATPDLLLLDEPTNHLDLPGIEWLEAYLSELPSAVLIVSHDRRLLDRAVTSIAEVEFGALTRYPGKYSTYLNLKAERFETEYRVWKKQADVIRKEESFIKKHMGSQRTAEAKGRQKKLRHIERVNQPRFDVRRPVIKPPSASRGGETVLQARGLRAEYDGRVIFSNVDMRIARGERIGIVGHNGTGKSTLLKILSGRRKTDGGEMMLGHRAQCGYYDQDTSDLREDSTPFLEIRRDHPQLNDGQVRGHLAKFLFRGDDVDSIVSSLSGGERARLVLSKLVLSAPSWLALDEPTNHLDLASRTSLEEMLGEYQGALVTVSHDREFLDGMCTVIISVENGTVTRFEGNYSAWRKSKDAEASDLIDSKAAATKVRTDAEKKQRAAEVAKAQPAQKQGKGKAKSKSPSNPFKLKKLEATIIKLEEKRESLAASMADEDVYKNSDLLRETQYALAEVERDLEQKNAQWESWA